MKSVKTDIDRGGVMLRKKGCHDKGIDKVKSLMQERRLPDYEAAELLFSKTQPKDEPIIPSN